MEIVKQNFNPRNATGYYLSQKLWRKTCFSTGHFIPYCVLNRYIITLRQINLPVSSYSFLISRPTTKALFPNLMYVPN